MARFPGAFEVSSNYEPRVAAPFDAREIVERYADLTNPGTWVDFNGVAWVYVGMIVTVTDDGGLNGSYRLADLDYTKSNNWIRLADEKDILELQRQIDDIEVGGGSPAIEVATESDLPLEGNSNATYYIKDTKTIKRWDAATASYVAYGGGSTEQIELINGGNANGG